MHRGYDPNGNVLSTSLPVETPHAPSVLTEQKTQMSYFDPGWPKSVDEPVKGVVTFDYAAQGWQTSRKAPVTPLETWSYSSGGLVTKNGDPNGDVNRFYYDIDSDLRTTNDSSGATSDDWRLRSEVDYSSFGERLNTRQFKRVSGVWTQFRTDLGSFDRNGNQAGRTDDLGGPGERAHTFVYDQADRLTTDYDDGVVANCADDQVVETSYLKNGWVSREEIRRRTSACEQTGWPIKQLTVSTYFDTGDSFTRKTYAGIEGPTTLVESHTLGYLQNGIYRNGHVVSDSMVLAKAGVQSGSWPCRDAAPCVASYGYDGRDRLVSWANGLPGVDALSIGYTLDPTTAGTDTLAGDIVREVTTTGTAPSQTTTPRDFTYGAGGQLSTLSVNSQPSERYFYGPQTGNLKCVTNDDTGGDPDPCALVNNQPKSFVRDWYKFDLLERLDRFVSKRSQAEVDTNYTYDAFDRIRSQTETRQGTTTSTFEYLGLSGAVSTETRASTTKAYSYDAYGQRVSMSVNGGATHTYARNPHGDISLLLGESGSATTSYGYRPYGELDTGLFAGDSDAVNPLNPYRFNDRRLDTGSNSIDMGARRFSPQVGRFLQQDFYRAALGDVELSSDPLTQNRYGFAGGNPISFIETDGHSFRSFLSEFKKAGGRAWGDLRRVNAFVQTMSPFGGSSLEEQERAMDSFMRGLDAFLTSSPADVYRALVDPCRTAGRRSGDSGLAGCVAGEIMFGAVGTKGLSVGSRGTKGSLVIGKMDDLRTPGTLKKGERTLEPLLRPNLHSTLANWRRNRSVLLNEMRKGRPIRDASVDRHGRLRTGSETGFLALERRLLRKQGWRYSPFSRKWHPPNV